MERVRRPRDTPIWKLEDPSGVDHAAVGVTGHAHMIKLTAEREITAYKWVYPDEER